MQRRVTPKWRPPLLLVLGGSLLAVLVLPILGLFIVEMLVPMLGRFRATLIVATGAVFATAVLGWLLWRLILQPVRALAARARTIRAGGNPTPVSRVGTPEIGLLSDAVMDMAEVLRARELAVRSYADHVTHELKTPLTAIRGAAELLVSDDDLSEEARKLARAIKDAETRAERLLGAARDIAAARVPEHRGMSSVAEALTESVLALEVELEGADVPLPLARDGLRIVLSHLLENAAQAGARRCRIEVTQSAAGPILTIADDGPGVSKGNGLRVFDPFFTTKRDRGGTGMGLAIVQTMLLAHGADIRLEEAPGGGAAFRITF